MAGMNRTTGAPLADFDHIRQSVADILTTPVGSRVMRRDYGSVLPLLVDQPLDNATVLRAYNATVIALTTWEPRIQNIRSITQTVATESPGRLALKMDAVADTGDDVELTAEL
ncbi:baseplate assembly protein [Salinisphaera sp. USBA-960]|nr:baseplate assembly protein [Salifodinibacter halophilus]NNC25304.1 baseplate assembly protein [Salifodinibacter halophilus]